MTGYLPVIARPSVPSSIARHQPRAGAITKPGRTEGPRIRPRSCIQKDHEPRTRNHRLEDRRRHSDVPFISLLHRWWTSDIAMMSPESTLSSGASTSCRNSSILISAGIRFPRSKTLLSAVDGIRSSREMPPFRAGPRPAKICISTVVSEVTNSSSGWCGCASTEIEARSSDILILAIRLASFQSRSQPSRQLVFEGIVRTSSTGAECCTRDQQSQGWDPTGIPAR
jgi:hypothetical protein